MRVRFPPRFPVWKRRRRDKPVRRDVERSKPSSSTAAPWERLKRQTYLDYCRTKNTRLDFKVQALASIKRILGDTRLKDLDTKSVDQFVSKRNEEGVSPATINRGLAILSHMLNYGLRRGYVDASPLLGHGKLREQELALRIMTVEEYLRLVEAVDTEEHTIGVLVAALGETALRKSEGLGLGWHHVNLVARKVTVEHSKSGKVRYVPLSQFAVECLSSLVRVMGCSHVFVDPATGRRWRDARGPFFRGRAASGLTWVRGFHDFRHFRATQWLMNGVDVNTVKELLGHADIHTTMRYVHYLQAHAEKAVKKAEKREIKSLTGR